MLDDNTVVNTRPSPMISIQGGEATTLPGIGSLKLQVMRGDPKYVRLYLSSAPYFGTGIYSPSAIHAPDSLDKSLTYERRHRDPDDVGMDEGFIRKAEGSIPEEAKYRDMRSRDYELMTYALNVLLNKIRRVPPAQPPSANLPSPKSLKSLK